MNRITFACTLLDVIGKDGTTARFQAGDIVRRKGTKDAWSDCIISGFSDPTKFSEVYVRLHRPYAYASCIGTTGPGVLVGTEKVETTAKDLALHFVKCPGGPMVSGSIAGTRPTYDGEATIYRLK